MSQSIEHARKIRNTLIAMGTFFSLFLAFMVWWVEFSWRGSFEVRAVTFRGSDNTPDIADILNKDGKPLLVHFSMRNCVCNRFSEEHIDHLGILLNRHVQAINVYLDSPINASNVDPAQPGVDIYRSLAEWAPAAPATAVWDANGELAYFGPYSDGAICGRGKDLVLYTLKNLVRGTNPSWINQEATGCFCSPEKRREVL